MSIQHGNKGIVKDGLVHYYNPLSLDSYRGEGGYNLLHNNIARCDSGGGAYWADVNISRVDFQGLNCFKAVTRQDGYLFSGTYYATGIILGVLNPNNLFPTGSYSFSCKIWAPAGRILSYGFRFYPQGEESSFIITGSNTWQTVKRENLTLTTPSHLSIQVRGYADNGASTATTTGVIPSFTFYVAEPMINSGSYAISYFKPDNYSILTTNVTGTDSQYSSLSNTFTKGSPGDSWTNARISSSVGFPYSAYLRFRPGQTDKYFMMALGSNPTSGINYTILDYAWYCQATGIATIFESGTGIADYGTYTTNSIFEIKYDGINVNYYIDNKLTRSVARSVGNPLYLDSSFYSNGAIATSVLFNNGRSNLAAGSGGYLDLTRVSNVNSDVNLLQFDATGAKATRTGSYVWFGGTNERLTNLTNDGNSHTYECWYMSLGGAFVAGQDGYFFGRQGFHTGFRQLISDATGATLGSAILWYSDNTNIGVPSVGSTAITLNRWYHLVLTVDEVNNVARAYITGSQWGADYTLTKPLRDYTTAPYFMYQANTNAYAANCRLGGVRLYNKALSAAEVLQNFNAQKHLYGY